VIFANDADEDHTRSVTVNLGISDRLVEPYGMIQSLASCSPRVILFLAILSITSPAQTLQEQAERTGRQVGSAARSYLLREPLYAATLAREFNMLEPEDELKWEVIHPSRTAFNFLPGDRLVTFAQMHGMKVRGHTLVWQRQLPPWLMEGNFSPAVLHHLLEEHIRSVVKHYRGKVFAWDVVNEAFDENGQLRSTLWYDVPGIRSGPGASYIETAFRWTHDADPDALLFISEAECETVNRKSDQIYKVAEDFRRRGVPLDGIGLQMHIFDLNPDFAGISANIHRFAALGLLVHITEMDVAVPVTADGVPRNPTDLLRQADIYRRIASICFSEPRCTAIQTWGFTDKYSWIRSSTHGTKGAALLFDASYASKPAYFALREGLLAPKTSPGPSLSHSR
jgi:endo-1,4-beta-xylanase